MKSASQDNENARAADRRRLRELLRASSVKVASEPIFHLASGKMSRFYVDCKQALSDPEARRLIGILMAQRIDADSLEAVGGMELGAYPIATAVSDAVFQQSRKKLSAFVVRKRPKDHGMTSVIAGAVAQGNRALIVEDVVTSGASTLQAIDSAREVGLLVDHVIAIVDREEEHGRENLEQRRVRFEALFRLRELLD